MEHYNARVEKRMKRLFHTLSEKDRRRYAAIEAGKLGGMAAPSMSPPCLRSIARRFARDWRIWMRPRIRPATGSENRGRTATADAAYAGAGAGVSGRDCRAYGGRSTARNPLDEFASA